MNALAAEGSVTVRDRRTVETHVAHVLRKLQLRSRVDIRLAATAAGATPKAEH